MVIWKARQERGSALLRESLLISLVFALFVSAVFVLIVSWRNLLSIFAGAMIAGFLSTFMIAVWNVRYQPFQYAMIVIFAGVGGGFSSFISSLPFVRATVIGLVLGLLLVVLWRLELGRDFS